ncbi:MAG: hypothetical protein ACRDSK_28360 [Actinophytocola sp.]|uniref:hypothetical protein n=1 Tax=Actinophytocola sp. TaxID=1872138 RepID=UPI003D6BFA47
MIRRALTAVVLGLLVAGCGVSSEELPQPIESTSIQPPPGTPSVDTSPADPSTTPPMTPPTTPSSNPPT